MYSYYLVSDNKCRLTRMIPITNRFYASEDYKKWLLLYYPNNIIFRMSRFSDYILLPDGYGGINEIEIE